MKKTKDFVGAVALESAHTSKARQNKGITLIALVITIIVMLILVAVTISMAINGGLFDYAGKAVSDTQNAIANEQELTKLEANMTVDELIDKYTGTTKGVDLNLLNIGDYVNYPVEYTNVATRYDDSTGAEKGYYPKNEFTGWRVLSKETDEQGNILYVKLISAGVPLSYYHYGNTDTSVQLLTTNFLTTEITSTLTQFKFYKCGFTKVIGATLAGTFTNDFTDKVQALTREELNKAVVDLGGIAPTLRNLLNDSKYKDLFAVPCKGNESSAYSKTLLATRIDDQFLYCVDVDSWFWYTERLAGVRPVVSLKSNVKFIPVPESEWINGTTTWGISI